METSSMDLPPSRSAKEIRPWYAVQTTVFDGDGKPVGHARSEEEARRIAAALNAVMGMPTEALEAWTTGSIQDPLNDLLGELESVLAPPDSEDRRRGERRRGDRRRALTEVRIEED